MNDGMLLWVALYGVGVVITAGILQLFRDEIKAELGGGWWFWPGWLLAPLLWPLFWAECALFMALGVIMRNREL